MFYSHEVLTSRKYGVATIWLVATLGAKSTARKVTRKAILDVNLKKACETIMEPHAPMALRLQSNLLYGVTRVYTQKWDYLLHDTQTIQTSMRAFMKTASNQLDMDAPKTKPEQLLLQDDPAFMIGDIQPPPLESDLGPRADSQRSSQSMLSIRGRSGSVMSNHFGSSLNINLPSSSHGGGGSYQVPDNDDFRESVQRGFGEPNIFNEEEQMILNDEDLFDFDANGNLIDIPANEREARRAGSMMPKGHIGSDSAASGRVRKEHEDALAARALLNYEANGDFNILDFEEGNEFLPDAEPFPAAAPVPGGRPLLNDEEFLESEEASSISAEAPAQRKKFKAKAKKKLAIDQDTHLLNKDIINNRENYLENMAAQIRSKMQHKAAVQAKKNAFHWVFGSGLNGVGEGVGASKLPHPLAELSGEALSVRLTGKADEAPLNGMKGAKRAYSDAATASDVEEESRPSKRARELELGRGENYEDDGMILNLGDDQPYPDLNVEQSIEVGRDAASALQDYPSSAHLPWNVSASAHSHQRARSSSAQALAGMPVSHRFISASPLHGRGPALPGDLDRFSQNIDDGMVMYGRSDNDDLGPGHMNICSSQVNAAGATSRSHSQHEDFEIFGAAAGIDTQTAGTSQWVRNALDKESNNFFEFVKNTISEKQDDDVLGGKGEEGDSVSFEELFDPEQNSAVVAAQAFYHVLSLATKRRVWVDQYGADDEIGGEIRIGIIEIVV